MAKDILFFPWRDWNTMKREGFRTREANVLLKLIENPKIERILCINRSRQPKYVSEILKHTKLGAYVTEYKGSSTQKNWYDMGEVLYSNKFSKLEKINDKLFILDISYHIPNPKGNRLESLGLFKRILKKEVLNAIREVKLTNYLTWCYDLSRIEIANELKYDLLVFDAIDNLLKHDQNIKQHNILKNQYNTVKRQSDIIFTVSQDLKNTIFDNRKNTYYIPNAINLELYNNINQKKPEDLPGNMPIVGYIGLMQERIDMDILIKSIEVNSDYAFVFIGPMLSPDYFKRLLKYKNVYMLGAKHHSIIPTYLNYLDVCIIPHKVNDFTKSMNPLKLYEYLAAGKEVITTPVPPSNDYKDIIHIKQNANEFANEIRNVVENPYRNFSLQNISEKIKMDDWKYRVNSMLKYIEEYKITK